MGLSSNWSNWLLIGITIFFGMINSISGEMKKIAFDNASNNAEYNRSVEGESVPILSRDIQVGDIIEIKDG